MMNVRGACFDIDGTLTTHLLGYYPVGYFEFILAGMLCRKGFFSFGIGIAHGNAPFTNGSGKEEAAANGSTAA